jgi:hypothetical protein
VTVTWAEANLVESATATAVTVTAGCAGVVAGAVYSPPDEIVPTVTSPPTWPFTCQLTAVSPELVTVATNT